MIRRQNYHEFKNLFERTSVCASRKIYWKNLNHIYLQIEDNAVILQLRKNQL